MPTAATRLGEIQGVQLDGCERYAGIRYAQAPVGELRFRPPQPVTAWEGVLDATEFGPVAPQAPPALAVLGQPTELRTDEDCLFLNVWTPRADDARRPVMVWIHGGAWIMGSGDVYDGSSFARRGDVVVVTLNYRLGVLGWLDLSHFDPALAGSGNNGLRDQIHALRWVRDNIDAFGGDPRNVTVFGESAGGGSIAALLGAPEAEGLFHRAIIQSGPANIAPDRKPEQYAAEILEALEVPGGGLDLLRSVPADALVQAQATVATQQRLGRDADHPIDGTGIGLRPAVDGVVVTRTPIEAVGEGRHRHLQLIIGTNEHEGTLFSMLLPQVDPAEIAASLEGTVSDPAALVAAYQERGTGRPLLVDLMTDALFLIPSLRLADAHVAAGGRAWVYLFTWCTPVFGGMLGATHALELPFVWDMLDDQLWRMFVGSEPPRQLGTVLQDAWSSFARSGDPNGGSVPPWPPYDTDTRPTLICGTEPAVAPDPARASRELWYQQT